MAETVQDSHRRTSGEVYDLGRQIFAETGALKEGLVGLKAEMQAFRGHMISLQTDVHNIYSILARHDTRLDRIEKRLGLIEPAI
jgi:hypothetical protein